MSRTAITKGTDVMCDCCQLNTVSAGTVREGKFVMHSLTAQRLKLRR